MGLNNYQDLGGGGVQGLPGCEHFQSSFTPVHYRVHAHTARGRGKAQGEG